MKRFLLLGALLCAFASVASATEITISGIQTTAGNRYTGSTATLRVYADQQFIASTGQIVMPGTTNYQEFNCTILVNVLTCSSIALQSTVDSSKNMANYTGVLFDSRHQQRDTLFSRWRLPITLGTAITYQQWQIYNSAAQRPLADFYASIDRVQEMINSAVSGSGAPKSGVGVYGILRTSVAPASAAAPIAVGDNDPRATAVQGIRSMSEFSSLGDAVGAIGSTPTKLAVAAPLTVSDNTTIPSTLILDFSTNGSLAVASGKTVTIKSPMMDVGTRRVFTGAGTVVFGAGAISRAQISWWTSGADVTDDTAAFTSAIASVAANNGGTVFLGPGTWRTTGDIAVTTGTTIEGSGLQLDSATVSTVLLTVNSKPAFKFGGNTRNIGFKNFRILALTRTGTVGVLAEGAQADGPGFDASFEHMLFNTLAIGIHFHATDSAWQYDGVKVEHSEFIGCTEGIKVNSINMSFVVRNSQFRMAANADGFVAESVGNVHFDHNFGGGPSIPSPYCSAGAPDIATLAHALVWIKGPYTAFDLQNSVTEAVGYFFINDNSDYNAVATLRSNFIQGRVQLNQSSLLTSDGNFYNAQEVLHINSNSFVWSTNDSTPSGNNLNDCGVNTGHQAIYINDSGVGRVNGYDYRNGNRFRQETSVFGHLINAASPLLTLGSNQTDAILLTLCQTGSTEACTNRYNFLRDTTTGYLKINGTQAIDLRGLLVNGPIGFVGESDGTPLSPAGGVVCRINTAHFFQCSSNGGAFATMVRTTTGLTSGTIPIGTGTDLFGNSTITYLTGTFTITGHTVTTGNATVSGNQTITGSTTHTKAEINVPVALTDAATIATDASLGNTFRVTLGGNRTLGAPTNPTDGQEAEWEILQDATGGRTLAYASAFAFGAEVTGCTISATIAKRSFLRAKYVSALSKWAVLRCVTGY